MLTNYSKWFEKPDQPSHHAMHDYDGDAADDDDNDDDNDDDDDDLGSVRKVREEEGLTFPVDGEVETLRIFFRFEISF